MFSTVHLPSSPTVASPILLPSLSFNTTLAPGTPVPDTVVSPAFGSVIVGFADVSSSAFAATFASTGSDTDLPSSFCVATTVSFSFKSIPAGTSAIQVPSSLTATSLAIGMSSTLFNARFTLDPAVPVPEIVWSPAVGAVTSGCALFSATGTSISFLPSGKSLSVTVTVIGPFASLPGVTSISPVSLLITGVTTLSFASLAETVVVLSGFVTIIPVPCFWSVGSTGFMFVSSTVVFLEALAFTVTGTSTTSSVPSG